MTWRRLRDRLPLAGWLFVLWCLLWGELTPIVLVSGLVIAPAAVAASRLPVLPVRMRPRWRRLPGVLWSLAADVARSSVEVAAATVSRRTPRAAVVSVALPHLSDIESTIIANRLSMVPGTLVIEINRQRDTLYVYVVPIVDAADARRKETHAVQVAEQIVALFATTGTAREEGTDS